MIILSGSEDLDKLKLWFRDAYFAGKNEEDFEEWFSNLKQSIKNHE